MQAEQQPRGRIRAPRRRRKKAEQRCLLFPRLTPPASIHEEHPQTVERLMSALPRQRGTVFYRLCFCSRAREHTPHKLRVR